MQLNDALKINSTILLEMKVSQINQRLRTVLKNTEGLKASKKEEQLVGLIKRLGLDELEKTKAQVTQWLPQDVQELKSLIRDNFMQYILKKYPSIKEVMDYLIELPTTLKPAGAISGMPAINPA